MDGNSAGEVAGIFAGIVALLASLGGGVKWLMNERKAERETREAKLQRWQDEVEAKEKSVDEDRALFHAKVERELALISDRLEARDRELTALRLAFELIAVELRRVDPENRALARAEQLLVAAFPLQAGIPSDMLKTLRAMREPGSDAAS